MRRPAIVFVVVLDLDIKCFCWLLAVRLSTREGVAAAQGGFGVAKDANRLRTALNAQIEKKSEINKSTQNLSEWPEPTNHDESCESAMQMKS